MSKSFLNSILTLATITLMGIYPATSALARADHTSAFSPQRTELSITTLQESNEPCYIEPSGFHTNIHWDGACRNAQPNAPKEPIQIAGSPPEPDQMPIPKQSKRVAKCKWTNVHCSGM